MQSCVSFALCFLFFVMRILSDLSGSKAPGGEPKLILSFVTDPGTVYSLEHGHRRQRHWAKNFSMEVGAPGSPTNSQSAV